MQTLITSRLRKRPRGDVFAAGTESERCPGRDSNPHALKRAEGFKSQK